MDKEQIKTMLRDMAGELRPLGIVHLHLHGSQVNGHARSDSDIDLAASFDRAKVRTALDEIALQSRISEILGTDVDLCDAERLETEVQSNFRREAELVF
jgi:predicted nucleotidyltransferase